MEQTLAKAPLVWNAILIAVGAVSGFAFGGWSAMLTVLVAASIIDYLTGWGAAAVEGKLNSKVGYKGIVKKLFIFIMVAVGHLVDVAIGQASVIMDIAIWFYLGNEFLSITENAGRAGLPVPEALKKAVEVLQNKGGGKDGN